MQIYKLYKSLPIQTAEIVKAISHMIANVTLKEFMVNLWWSVIIFKRLYFVLCCYSFKLW